MKMVEPKQIQLIHIAKAQLGLSDDDYRLIIRTQTKGEKHSSKELTYFEADRLIDYFVKTLGFKIQANYIRESGAAKRARRQIADARQAARRPPESRGNRPCAPRENNVFYLASPDQMKMIEALAGKIVWRVEGGYLLWLKKYMKIERIKTAGEAEKVIEGLKGMLAHQTQGEHPCCNG